MSELPKIPVRVTGEGTRAYLSPVVTTFKGWAIPFDLNDRLTLHSQWRQALRYALLSMAQACPTSLLRLGQIRPAQDDHIAVWLKTMQDANPSHGSAPA